MSESNIEELKDLKSFSQKPVWNADSKFELSGLEFEHIFNILQPFMSVAMVFQSLMDKAINDGTITIKYEYNDGSGEVTEEEVKHYTEKFMKMLDAQKKQKQEQEEKENIKPLNSKIITEI